MLAPRAGTRDSELGTRWKKTESLSTRPWSKSQVPSPESPVPTVIRLRRRQTTGRMHRFSDPRRGPRPKESHGSALPVLRKDPHGREAGQPCPQRHQPEMASEPEGGPGGRRWADEARASLHPLHPVGKAHQAGRPLQSLTAIPSSRFQVPGGLLGTWNLELGTAVASS